MVAAASPSAPAPPTTENGDDSGTPVIMPHISLSETELNVRHPRLEAPDEVLSADPTDDSRDVVFQHGLKIAREIQQHAIDHGRLRHTEEATKTRAETTAIATATASTAATSTASSTPTARATRTASTTTTSAPASSSTSRTCSLEATAVAYFSSRSGAGGVLRDGTCSRTSSIADFRTCNLAASFALSYEQQQL